MLDINTSTEAYLTVQGPFKRRSGLSVIAKVVLVSLLALLVWLWVS